MKKLLAITALLALYAQVLSAARAVTVVGVPADSAIYKEEALDQVVITGTRTPKLLSRSPVLTEVISAPAIEKSDATNLRDLLQLVMPGVEFSYSMNQEAHLNFSGFGGQSMLILVDGERLAGETMDDVDFTRLSMQDVDHVEIVRGAASALYGSNAVGGVMNIITKENSRPFAATAGARWGKHNDQRYTLTLASHLGRWDNNFTAMRTSADNYNLHSDANPVTRVLQTIYGDKVWNFQDKLTYRPWQNVVLTGRAGYFYRTLSRTADTPERYRDFTGGLRGQWAITQRDVLEMNYAFDEYDKSDYQKIARLDIRDYSNVQNTLRLLYSHTFADRSVFSAGADYLHDYLWNIHLNGKYHQDSFDAFAQMDWNISPRLEAVAALRYDYFSIGPLNRLTPKVSLRYEVAPGLNLRLGYGMGFRAPALKEKYYNYDIAGIWTVLGDPNLKAETSHNFNVSAEYTNGHYNLTLNAYCNDITNHVASGAPYFAHPDDPIPTLPYINVDRYIVAGVQATAQARWPGGITARLSYAFTDEDFQQDQDGNKLASQFVPARKHTMTGHVDWDHRFCSFYCFDIALDGRFLSSVDNREFIDYYDVDKGVTKVHYPAYALFRLTTSHSFGHHQRLRATVTVDNLLNYKPRYYYLNSPITTGTTLLVGLTVKI